MRSWRRPVSNPPLPRSTRPRGRPRETITLSGMEELTHLRAGVQSRVEQCFAPTTRASLASVVDRRNQFLVLAQAICPQVTLQEANLLFVEKKLQSGAIQPSSAEQYLTYLRMAEIADHAAYRRSLELQDAEFNRRELALQKEISGVTIVSTLRSFPHRTPSDVQAALALQWSVGARYIDLQRLRRCHVQRTPAPECWMVVFVHGKTDRRGAGQAVLIRTEDVHPQRFGLFLAFFLESLASGRQELVFPELTPGRYNRAVKHWLDSTSHYVRHAALTWVASRIAGMAAPQLSELEDSASTLPELVAQSLGRHREAKSTRMYTPQHTWATTRATLVATRMLQQEE